MACRNDRQNDFGFVAYKQDAWEKRAELDNEVDVTIKRSVGNGWLVQAGCDAPSDARWGPGDEGNHAADA